MFKKAIDLIMAQPPELHYPAYFADLLRKADVPDKDVGKCSEIPNNSETIYRQAAIDAINCDITITGKQNAEVVAETIASFVDRIKALPSAQPERKKGEWIDAVLPNDSGGLQVQVCDQCNTFFPLAYTGGGHNFCPNCGADMRGEQDED